MLKVWLWGTWFASNVCHLILSWRHARLAVNTLINKYGHLTLARCLWQAKRNPRATEVGPDVSKQHLVLISEGFPEGKLAIRRAAVASNTAVASNAAVASGLAAKLEPLLTTATPTSQTAVVRPSGVSTSKFTGK